MSDPTSNEEVIILSRPMPLFPLDSAVLLPQQVIPLHIFEERYRQMVSHALDGAGLIAMGVFRGDNWKQEYHGRPPVRPAVCVGQIAQHEHLPDGRFNIALHGICRAKLQEELPPDEGTLYRRVMIHPMVSEVDEGDLDPLRDWLDDALAESPLTRHAFAEKMLDYVRNEEIATSTVLDLVSFTMTEAGELRYKLLAEGDATKRAAMLRAELEHVQEIIRKAQAQHPEDWPKGCSWN